MFKKPLYPISALALALVLIGSAQAQPPGRGGPGRRAGPGGGLERVLDDLKLSDTKKDQALAAVRAYQENTRKLMDLARAELLLKMKELLSEQEFTQFKDALDRPPALANARGGRGAGGFGNRGLTADQIVERILSFDKNKDGKITKEELPERMQDLIARGDTNKDGALDSAEIKKLATDLARDRDFRRFDNRGGAGGRFGAGGRGGPGSSIERALDDLKLAQNKKDRAETAVKAHRDTVRKLMDVARADLLLKMTGILSSDELKEFTAALDRQPGFGARPNGPDGPIPSPARPAGTSRSRELEQKLDQLQKEVEDLRREIRR